MKVSEAMRLADEMGLPNLRRDFIAQCLLMWEGEKPPCCAIGGAAVASRDFRFEEASDEQGFLSDESYRSAQYALSCSDWDAIANNLCNVFCPDCGRRAGPTISA
ncbi:MAG: hypothetical protein KGL39_43460, partial [Patescibacteria group bacterium]|nr:hypothetical protein [Patescibacteria group bacterium]